MNTEKKFINKVQKVSFTYKYIPSVASKFISKEMIYDYMFMRLIEELKRDGFIKIKEIEEEDEITTISMCINVLKNNFKEEMEE